MPMWKIILKKLFLYAHVENTKVYAHVEVSDPPDFFLPLDVRRRTQGAGACYLHYTCVTKARPGHRALSIRMDCVLVS